MERQRRQATRAEEAEAHKTAVAARRTAKSAAEADKAARQGSPQAAQRVS